MPSSPTRPRRWPTPGPTAPAPRSARSPNWCRWPWSRSLGNESDYGANHDAAAGWVRRHDPTRPVPYEGAAKLDWAAADDASDIACPMYAPIEDCAAHALSGEQTRPLIPCEYAHAMGNSNGTLADHWSAIESTPGLQGSFIWEFWDHGILQRVTDGRPAGRSGAGPYDNGVAAPGYRWAYGGDFGEAIHDGAFIADGIVFPDRTPKPVMYEHREIAAPVLLQSYRHEGPVVLNHQCFRGLDWLEARWELTLADGRTLTAPAELPDLRPGETAALPLPFALPDDGGEAWVTLRVTTKDDEPWGPRGTEVCAPQLRLRGAQAECDAIGEAFELLDRRGVGYSVLAGNHDVRSSTNDQRGATPYLDTFGPEPFAGKPTFGGASPDGYNTFHLFKAAGREWLVLALDWRLSDKGYAWAKDVIARHPSAPVILTTHELVYGDDALSSYGQQLWDKLVKDHDQIFLTLNGHYWPAARAVRKNAAGNDVHLHLTNYQNRYYGGAAMIRLYHFDLDRNTIDVETLSPWILGRAAKGLNELEREEMVLSGDADRFSVDIDSRDRDHGRGVTLGGRLRVRKGERLTLSITVTSASRPNPQGILPELAHVDVIRGAVRGPVADRDSWRAPDTKVVHTRDVSGRKGTYTLRIPLVAGDESFYVRLRGSDGNRNGAGYLGASVDPHGPIVHEPGNGDPWADTWFYSNPVFVDVKGV
ncbi:glycoside hydrolase family 2 TIM barrel-domain containing protein [Streptomyces sp. P17]|uniref:glycoside hydrolase family 2 TIM barrel-domain containing protein n=1 Tax=Streptomyces sp. P17 TaxID=3074716 RepID=UPI0028F40152|nr:glycoside hydrolase family 2 TIM barrel-domain containing protein [Streptomyces sp. P17]MDT9700499.1 glycoside hydrolase family 2 TIM barrel-domain containing protein [Streptomyces sp. P17]